MPVSDPVAIAFVNQQVRMNAETTRAAFAQLEAYLGNWQAFAATLIPPDGGSIEDGREAEGVTRVTAAEVNAFTALAAQIAAIASDPANAAGVAALQKLCVRPPRFIAANDV